MFETLQRVNAALARVQPELPPTAKVTANRSTFACALSRSRVNPLIGASLKNAIRVARSFLDMVNCVKASGER